MRVADNKRIENVEGLLREAALMDTDSFLLRDSHAFYRDPSSLLSLENYSSTEAVVVHVDNGVISCKLYDILLKTNL